MSRARRAKKPELGELMASARLRHYGVGPRKVRDIANLIRGLTVAEAQQQLLAVHRPSAVPMMTRLLKSAISNFKQAEDQGGLEPEDLVVGRIMVDSGPIQYRMRPMSMGKSGRIRKRTCHVTLELYEEM